MDETPLPAKDWAHDETMRSLLDIFDRADRHARMRLTEATRISEERLAESQASVIELHARKEECLWLRGLIAERDQEIARLRAEVATLKEHVRQLSEAFSGVYNSFSWRITRPIRLVRRAFGLLLHPPGGR